MANDAGSVIQKTLYSTWLNIYGNVLISTNVCMQIRNVSQVFFGELPKKKFPTISFLLLLLSGIAVIAIDHPRKYHEPSPIFAFAVFALIAATIVFLVYISSKPLFGLHIVMNSGATYTFTSSNSDFIKKAYEVLCERFNQPDDKATYMTVNFGSGTIVNHPKVAGNINL